MPPCRILATRTPLTLPTRSESCLSLSSRPPSSEVARFNERFGGYAVAEDEDLFYRVSRRGRVCYLSKADIVHRKTGFASQDQCAFGRTVILNGAYFVS
jgi:hypothetical protein